MPPLADDLENVSQDPRLLVTFCVVLAHSHSETHWKELEMIACAVHGAISVGGIHTKMTLMTQGTAGKGTGILVTG